LLQLYSLDKHSTNVIVTSDCYHHLTVILFSDTRGTISPYVACQSENPVFSLVRYKICVFIIPNIDLINMFSICHDVQKSFHGACDFLTVIYRSKDGGKRIIIKFSLFLYV